MRDLAEIEKLARCGPGLDALRAKSGALPPGRLTHYLLQQLFPAEALLCLGLDARHAYTLALADWLEIPVHQLQFIVPSPMSSKLGHRLDDGRPSFRTKENTGPRRYLVVECDFSELSRTGKTETVYAPLLRSLAADGITVADMCSAVLWHLDNYLPLVMVVSSGGKSLHGWYSVVGLPGVGLLRVMRYAVTLAGDSATWSRCQLVRLPDATRGWNEATGEPGPRQSVEDHDPEALP